MSIVDLPYILFGLGATLHLLMLACLRWGWDHSRCQEAQAPAPETLPPISVLIAARNDAEQLQQHLPVVCELRYAADFEVIVALNDTDDHSRELLQTLSGSFSQLRWLDLGTTPSGWPGKKWALQQAARVAKYEHLAFIDADCRPEPDWLRGLGGHFARGKEWVLGLGWHPSQPGWLNRFIRYETLYTAVQYIGAAALRQPYMAVGRNLGYHRRFLTEGKGLGAWRDSLSGDDDLMVNALADPDKTAGMMQPGTRTWSAPANSWPQWIQQKTRHVSASPHYSLSSKALLSAFHLSHLLWHGAACWAVIQFVTLSPVLWLYPFTVLLKASLLYGPAQDTGERGLLLSLFGLELSYFLYNLSVVPLGLIKRPEWRNRALKYPKIPKKTEH